MTDKPRFPVLNNDNPAKKQWTILKVWVENPDDIVVEDLEILIELTSSPP